MAALPTPRMLPDYLRVMLVLLRRDAALVADQWSLAYDLADEHNSALDLGFPTRPARDAVRYALYEQVAQALCRLCAHEEGTELGLASLVNALRREGEESGQATLLEDLLRACAPLTAGLPKAVRKSMREEPDALPTALKAIVPGVLVRVQNALDALAGAYLAPKIAA